MALSTYESLLDMDSSVNVELFDQLVEQFYQNNGGDTNLNTILTKFADHPKSWVHSSEIILNSQSPNSKLLAFSALQRCIQTRWGVLPEQEKQGIRRFIETAIVETCQNINDGSNALKPLLTKMNTTLIEVVKHEWPHNWNDFLPSIIQYAQGGEAVCINVVSLLRIFSEEVFTELNTTMTTEKIHQLQENLRNNGSDIFVFFLQILKNSKNVILLQETLRALINYVRFLPLEYVFESDLIELLTLKFFPTEFQLRALECMCQIVSLEGLSESSSIKNTNGQKLFEYRQKLFNMFQPVVETFQTHMPENTDVAQLLRDSGHQGETFVRLFTTLACTYLRHNIRYIEQQSSQPEMVIINSLQILIQTTAVKDDEILIVVTNFWEWWSGTQEDIRKSKSSSNFTSGVFSMRKSTSSQNQESPYFQNIIGDMSDVLVLNMVRPKEVLVTRDALQNFVENEMKESMRLQIYKNMSLTLQRLCKINSKIALASISKILQGHFGNLTEQNNFNEWCVLNSVCWSIGSISNSVGEQESKDFLVKAIQALLYLCERTPEKADKAIVAANIMYVVRKNPKFLQRYWKLLQTVIGKLFEFMTERFPGVQDMACETFEEIARRCRHAFSSDRQEEATRFLENLLHDLPSVVQLLPPKLLHQLWKGFGWIIRAEKNDAVSRQLLLHVMTVPNMVWVRAVERFQNNPVDALNDLPLCTNLINVLQTNRSLCETLKEKYFLQLGKIMEEVMQIYSTVTNAIRQYGERNGANGLRHDICMIWRNIVHNISNLLTMCISTQCLRDFDTISNIMDVMLSEFSQLPIPARDHAMFIFCRTVVEKLQNQLDPILSPMLNAIIGPTKEMIDNDDDSFPDHRREFFELLSQIVKSSFQSLINLPAEQFHQVVNVLVWSAKHVDAQMAEIGLNAIYSLLQKISTCARANDFYSTYLAFILNETFVILTDTMHKAGFKLQVNILRQVIYLIDFGNVTVMLWSQGANFNSNRDCVKHSIMNLAHNQFPNLSETTIINFADQLFRTCQKYETFEACIRDFLVKTRQVELTNVQTSI